MKHQIYLLILFSFLFCLSAGAQQNRFVYIQTENQQPFYVKINSTVFSSSSSGYLIIPKLKDGTYPITVGFPKNDWPQQNFSFNINKKDMGFLLKDLGEKGWGLFNLQTSELLTAKNTVSKNGIVNTSTDDDPFTQALSDVVNTPDLKKKTEVPPVPVEKVKVQPKKEEVVIRDEPVTKEATVIKKVLEKSIVKQIMNNKDDKGRVMIYTDQTATGLDTIRIFIAASQEEVTTAARNIKPKETKEKFMDIELQNPNVRKDSAVIKSSPATTEPVAAAKPAASAGVVMINSDCRVNATDEDFIKLRKKMAGGDNDDDMLSAAKKAFRSKCYSTAQVKNLGILFLNDAGRYQFFDAAYPYVYDTGNFSSLQQQLTDPYFITRFQAMIRR